MAMGRGTVPAALLSGDSMLSWLLKDRAGVCARASMYYAGSACGRKQAGPRS